MVSGHGPRPGSDPLSRKDAGTATLKAGNEIWNYLPRVDRTIKIPASLMSASWMGSHFTNDDLVKESRLIEDYEITLAYEGDRDGVDVWEFDLIPRPEAPVVWGTIRYQVRKDDTMPVYARYYDEDGALMRTLTFSDHRSSVTAWSRRSCEWCLRTILENSRRSATRTWNSTWIFPPTSSRSDSCATRN